MSAPLELWWERTGGHGERGDAVLLHGLAGSSDDFPAELDARLGRLGFGTVRIDLRDSGRSPRLDADGLPRVFELLAGDRDAAPYRLVDMARDVVQVLERASVSRALLVGVSLGGMVAQHVTVIAPERAAGLCLVSSASQPDLASLVDPTVLAPLLRAGLVALDAGDGDSRGGAGALRQLGAVVASDPWREAIAQCAPATLIVHGAADPLIGVRAAFDTWAELERARLVVIAERGHEWTTSAWDVVWPHLARFGRSVR